MGNIKDIIEKDYVIGWILWGQIKHRKFLSQLNKQIAFLKKVLNRKEIRSLS